MRLSNAGILPLQPFGYHSLYSEALVSFDTYARECNPRKARGFIDIESTEQQAQMRQKRTLD